jgi:hypothetical protein
LVKDITYDLEEKHWHCMGLALGILNPEETSPCIGFDSTHPLAPEGIKLADKLLKRGGN